MDSAFEEWLKDFDDRQRKQIMWSELYNGADFKHGDNGHNDKLIIAKMAQKLRHYEQLLSVNDIDLTGGF